ncbi:MAG: asparagine synthase (glutamine-hydrolyzing) [Syntrophaceae bacterium]|nr:asparagine synthase (glutamine-hydrolyzing) [Syntrophaceae bacterium]
MCGIAGIINKDPVPTGTETLRAMMEAMGHRGPDDEGIYSSGQLSLGHRRLSIIDLSPAGRQPMRFRDLVIIYNGEIYNYLELRQELESLGRRFETGTDTEVILQAFDAWGDECLQRFTGMWAFAIFDEAKREIFLARDRFGIKPLYYRDGEKRFLFASEIKAILAGGVTARMNEQRLIEYLVVGITDHTEETCFEGIHQLLPGCWMRIDLLSGRIRGQRYYYPADRAVTPPPTGDDFAAALKRSVHLHLRSDVPVGTCLSGGLDSSVVAALAAAMNRENGNSRFDAVTARSENPETDETPYARQVVGHCGLRWHVAAPGYEDFAGHIEACLWFQEEPVGSPSVFMQYWVMKKAKEAGLKVMLDGQGGDETLLGYERYYIAYFLELLRKGRLRDLLREYILAVRNSRMSFWWFLASVGYFSCYPLRRSVLKRRSRFLKREALARSYPLIRSLSRDFFRLRDLQITEIMGQQLSHLLRYEDRNSMAFSIEARVPFIEADCVRTALDLPAAEKIREGYTKYPLRKLAEEILPGEIAWRRNKIGFEAPADLWQKRHQAVMQAEIDRSCVLNRICNRIPDLGTLNTEMQWRLYNIAIWERMFDVSSQD